jgi:hypothetical protein
MAGWKIAIRCGFGDGCARAARGHAVAAPPTINMKSRRRIADFRGRESACAFNSSEQEIAMGEMGATGLRFENLEPLMSATGHPQPEHVVRVAPDSGRSADIAVRPLCAANS